MPETVTVQKVIGASKPWQDSYGNSNVDWSVQLTDGRTVTRGMREGKAGPNEGDQWEVESWDQKGDFPPKAKGVTFVGSGSSSNGSQGALAGTYKPPGGPTDNSVHIIRQHTQKAAVDLVIAGKNHPEDVEQVLEVAEQLEHHVLRSLGGTGTEGSLDHSSSEGAEVPQASVPSGAAPTTVDVLKARLERNVDPDTFAMLVASVGAESVQGATDEQRAEIVAQMEGL